MPNYEIEVRSYRYGTKYRRHFAVNREEAIKHALSNIFPNSNPDQWVGAFMFYNVHDGKDEFTVCVLCEEIQNDDEKV